MESVVMESVDITAGLVDVTSSQLEISMVVS